MFNQSFFEESIDTFYKINSIALDCSKKTIDSIPEINKIIEKTTPAINEVQESFQKWGESIVENPKHTQNKQQEFLNELTQLQSYITNKIVNKETEKVIQESPNDKRFKHKDWEENLYFDSLKQFYLLFAKWFENTIENQPNLDEKNKNKVLFHAKQLTAALSPNNFLATNPEVLEATINEKGNNLKKGFNKLLNDLKEGSGQLKISQSSNQTLKIGENMATTKGKIIFQNRYFELIQYEPSTKGVYQTPILIVPPFINKYYILDINEQKSFVKPLIKEGFTVFMMSWVNPDESYRNTTFDDYVINGVEKALNIIKHQLFAKEIHTIGYCVGGTLLATTAAYLAKKGNTSIKSMTLLSTFTDFENVGEMEIFITEKQIAALEAIMEEKGYFDDKYLYDTFNSLKSNDLLWPFLIQNYLLGKEPKSFDILFWNSDGIRLPEKLYSQYLRQFYLNNALSNESLMINSETLNLNDITCDAFLVASKNDHIVPWESSFVFHKNHTKNSTFVLNSGGHISSVAHNIETKKQTYQCSNSKRMTKKWLKEIETKKGSWFYDWYDWLKGRSGSLKTSKKVSEYRRKTIADAPGTYVLKTNK